MILTTDTRRIALVIAVRDSTSDKQEPFRMRKRGVRDKDGMLTKIDDLEFIVPQFQHGKASR